MNEDEATAFEAGRVVGRMKSSFAGDCPFPHGQHNLRQAWMDGFGQERHHVVKLKGVDEAADQGDAQQAAYGQPHASAASALD